MYKSGTVLGKVNNTENKTNSGTYKSGMVLGKVSESALRTEQSSVKTPHYKESSQNQAKQQSATDFLFSQLPTGNVRQDIKNQQQMIKSKTTIPSVDYNEGFATELKLKKEMSEAEKAYKEAQSTFNINPVMKDFSSLGLADDKKVQPYKDAFEKKKKEYEKYKTARYYSIMPNGEYKTTNPDKKDFRTSKDKTIDWEYEYINGNEGLRKTIKAGDGSNPYALFGYMSDREIGIYNYLYASKGKKEARKFLNYITDDLEERSSAEFVNSAQEYAKEHPYMGAVASIPANVLAAGEQVGDIAENILTGDMNRNTFADVSSALRGALPEKVNWEINNWDAFDFLYNTGMSAIDSVAMAPLGTAGAVMLGLSAAASSTNDIIDRGGTNSQAFWGGIAAGVFEGFFEKFSIGQLETMQDGMVKGFKDYAKNVGKAMLTNASEETATEIANVLYDYAANGGISQYAVLVKEYMQDPDIDEATAKKKAAQKLGLQILEAGASGALMGFGFGSLGSAVAYRNYRKDTSFAKQVDDVLNGKHNPRYDLYVSETPKVFTDIGFPDSALLMRNSKVKEILEKHSEMSVDTIKKIPQAIQEPILVLKSKTNPKQSVVAITDIETEKGNMIVPIWINQEGNYIDIDLGTDVVTETNFVASAYGRNVKTLIEFANENDGFLYQNEDTEKVRQLLARNGLQLPTPLKLSDSDINVPQNDTDVNNNISTGAENNSNLPENTLDSMLDESKDDEGRPTFREPEKKDIFRAPTAEEQMNTIIGKHENVEQRHLKDVAKKLGVNLRWDNDCSRGYYDPATNTIAINPFWSVTKCYYTLFKHEFVHYLETKSGYDSFKKYLTNHSKAFYEYVRGKLEQKGIEFTGGREGALAAYTDIVLKERQAAEEIPYRIRKGYNTEKIHREIIADFVGDVLLGGESVTKAEQALLEIAETNRSLFQKIQDWLRDVISFLKGESKNRTLVEDLEYLNNRLARVWDSAQKRNADKGEVKYSIVEPFIDNNGKEFDNAVLLDTDFFEGLSPRNWGSKLKDYVYNRAKNNPFIMTIVDENGRVQKLQFATPDERVRKDNASNHKVIDKLSSSSDNISKLAVIHIDEIVEVSKENNPYYTNENNHQWLDKNGWLHRNANVINRRNGNVYNIIFDIAKSEDGRIILYATDGKIKKVGNVQVNSLNIRGSGLNSNFNISIPDKKSTVNNNSIQESENYSDDSKFSHKKLSPINDSEKFAAKMLRQNRSNQDKEVLAKQLKEISNAIAESDYGRAMKYGIEAARGIIESSKNTEILSDEATEILKDIRKTAIKLSDAQKQEVAFSFGSYNDFRKRNMGRINLTNEGVELDTAWQSWSEQYPQLFEQDMPSGDMPVALANIIDSLKADYVDFDFDSAIDNLASQIFTECIKDMQGTQSDNIKKAITELEERHWDYVIDSIRYTKQLYKRVRRQNEQLAKRSSEISAEITAQREERASKQKNIKHIRKVVSCIDKMFRTNSEKKHIPEKLKEASAYFIKIFVDNDASPFDKKEIRNIRTLYNDLYTKGDKGFKIGGIDTETLEYLEQLEEKLEGKTLRQLNNAEILLIKDITDNFYHIIQDENEMFFEGKKRKVEEIGTQALKELKSEKSKRENGIINATDKYIKYSNMTPIYFFDRIGGVFKSLFYDVVYAQDKWYRNVENAKTYIRQQKEKYNYDKWDNDTFKFTTEKGDEIEITREQAMLLYATARREYLKKGTPTEHLFRGGVVIPPSQITLKVILKKCKESDAKGIAKITDAMVREIDSKAHRIMPQDIVRVMEWLTKEQIGYANAMVKYLSNDMAALGNEVSLQLYGITKFNEEYYIPYNSAQNYLYSQPGVSNEARLKHQSFTKETVHGANNPLVLSDFSEVCADHINRMCMYNAFTIPLENMTKIFNYQRKGENVDTVDIKAEIERVHGKAATDYIEHFLTDMNGNVRTSGTDKLIGWLISKFKKGAVFASASVVVQQPSAVMRAMTYINPKYFISTTLKLSERDYQQAVEYAPVAGIKEMGRFDTGVGAATTNWLLQETPKGFKNKVKAFVDI